VPVVPWEGPRRQPPDQLPNFYTRLNVTLTAKKGRQHFGEEKVHPTREKIQGTRMRKGPPPYVGMGPPNG